MYFIFYLKWLENIVAQRTQTMRRPYQNKWNKGIKYLIDIQIYSGKLNFGFIYEL